MTDEPNIPTPKAPTLKAPEIKVPKLTPPRLPTLEESAAAGLAANSPKPRPNYTSIDHHFDGSHTVSHEYDDPAKNISYAKADLNGVNDGLDEHLS
jgi:hypothetical protein